MRSWVWGRGYIHGLLLLLWDLGLSLVLIVDSFNCSDLLSWGLAWPKMALIFLIPLASQLLELQAHVIKANFMWCWGQNSELRACQAGVLPNELHPQSSSILLRVRKERTGQCGERGGVKAGAASHAAGLLSTRFFIDSPTHIPLPILFRTQRLWVKGCPSSRNKHHPVPKVPPQIPYRPTAETTEIHTLPFVVDFFGCNDFVYDSLKEVILPCHPG